MKGIPDKDKSFLIIFIKKILKKNWKANKEVHCIKICGNEKNLLMARTEN